VNNSKNVLHYCFEKGAINYLGRLLENRRDTYVVFFVDAFFKGSELESKLPILNNDKLIFVETINEPKTSYINEYRDILKAYSTNLPTAIVGIGGGILLDTAKAVANLVTNDGNAEDFQGWDLVKNPGIYKIGVPTLSGTGAEGSRTCVMTNVESGLKLGMNSDYTMYDQLLLDPDLTKSVPREQYFYTGMDTYIHCIESLNGQYRHAMGDAYAHQAISLVKEVFLSDDMMSEENREKLMAASLLGGQSIANSFVGVIHPFSAGLSVVLDTHHCIANCITMNAMEEFYPKEYLEFMNMADKQNIEIPKNIACDLTDEIYQKLYDSTIIHEKPLINALGNDFKLLLTFEKVKDIFKRM
jgi:3-deoxy-alpha-D-manno-octulosonate 8-oxidase